MIPGLNDTFIIMNADVLTNLNFQELVAYHKTHDAIATVSAYERQITIDLGVIVKDGGCHIKDYVEKPTISHLVSMGIYVFEPQVLEFIKENDYLDFPDLVKQLLQVGRVVNYYPFDGYWLDIGRHEDYAQAAEEFNSLKGELGL
jgi:NDP-sugar pyrophosphorylase family protein